MFDNLILFFPQFRYGPQYTSDNIIGDPGSALHEFIHFRVSAELRPAILQHVQPE